VLILCNRYTEEGLLVVWSNIGRFLYNGFIYDASHYIGIIQIGSQMIGLIYGGSCIVGLIHGGSLYNGRKGE
jgi:hypothetical protein